MWYKTAVEHIYIKGQHSSQNQALKLVFMHSVFLHAQGHISGCVHAKNLKLGMKHLYTISR